MRRDLLPSGVLVPPLAASAASAKTTSCTLQEAMKGGGLIAVRTSIEDGTGRVSAVRHIPEVSGTNARAEATAGAVEAGEVQGPTTGEVSLAVAGTGRGWEQGVAAGDSRIERAGGVRTP